MKYLLDTHTLIWFLMGDKKLSNKARELIDNPSNEKHLSIASLWEIAIKVSLGKLALSKPFEIVSRATPFQSYSNIRHHGQ